MNYFKERGKKISDNSSNEKKAFLGGIVVPENGKCTGKGWI